MKNFEISVLTANSRYLQTAALKTVALAILLTYIVPVIANLLLLHTHRSNSVRPNDHGRRKEIIVQSKQTGPKKGRLLKGLFD